MGMVSVEPHTEMGVPGAKQALGVEGIFPAGRTFSIRNMYTSIMAKGMATAMKMAVKSQQPAR